MILLMVMMTPKPQLILMVLILMTALTQILMDGIIPTGLINMETIGMLMHTIQDTLMKTGPMNGMEIPGEIKMRSGIHMMLMEISILKKVMNGIVKVIGITGFGITLVALN